MQRLLIAFLFTLFNFSSAYSFYGKEFCNYPDFTCIKVEKGQTWENLWPDANDRNLIMRFNRTNLPLSTRHWIVVPKDLHNLTPWDLSPFPLQISPPEHRFLIIDLRQLAFGAYDNTGRLTYWGPISGGKSFCEDIQEPCNTPLGSFRIQRIQGANCISSQFPVATKGGAPMPYCMHFYNGFAIHGSSELPGKNASHGCVRLYTADAEWLNKNFIKIGTEIKIITSDEPQDG
jgi:L,D-transpeptidase ErfK/SrfK